jgi:predicted metal-dependent hydrolase
MQDSSTAYDYRYLGGILFFNERDFFEAHEVWESIWMESTGPERRFYQGLIQAAVALYHFGNGNLRGALKLYRSGHNYMQGLGSPYHGLNIAGFWEQMGRCCAGLLGDGQPDSKARLEEELIPQIVLDPPPEHWPDLAQFATEE